MSHGTGEDWFAVGSDVICGSSCEEELGLGFDRLALEAISNDGIW